MVSHLKFSSNLYVPTAGSMLKHEKTGTYNFNLIKIWCDRFCVSTNLIFNGLPIFSLDQGWGLFSNTLTFNDCCDILVSDSMKLLAYMSIKDIRRDKAFLEIKFCDSAKYVCRDGAIWYDIMYSIFR